MADHETQTAPMVMRSLYLNALQDRQLRDLAYQTETSKSDIVRAALTYFLKEMAPINDADKLRAMIKGTGG